MDGCFISYLKWYYKANDVENLTENDVESSPPASLKAQRTQRSLFPAERAGNNELKS
jgi:hypothetical protein